MNEIDQIEYIDTVNVKLLDQTKNESEHIQSHRKKGSAIRSRAKWIEEGEKP